MWTDAVWNGLNASSVYTAVGQIALGGIFAHLKIFVPSEQEFRNRYNLRCEALAESLNVLLNRLLKQVDYPEKLRGMPPLEPDLIAEYTAATIRAAELRFQMLAACTRARRGYTWLFTTFLLGFAVLLVSLPIDALRPWTAALSILFIASQLVAALTIRAASTHLDTHEGAPL